MSSARAASSCTAAIAAWSWYGADRALRDSVARDERDALGDRRSVPQRAVLLVERDQLAVRPGARRAARVGEQHQREQPGDLAVVGQQRGAAARASRIASLDRSARCRSGPLLVV